MTNPRRAVLTASVGLALLGLNAGAAQEAPARAQVSYEVSADQVTVLPLEPVFLTFTVANRTVGVVRDRLDPDISSATILIRQPGGQTVESSRLSTRLGKSEAIGERLMAPGEVRASRNRLEVNLDRFFPTPGTYQVRFKASDDSGTPFWSNVVVLRVLEPTGADRAAYDFLRESPNAGWWFASAKKSELDDFLIFFPDSAYADVARLELGMHAHAAGDYELATQLLTAVAASKGRLRLSEYAAEQLQVTRKAVRASAR